MINGQLLFYGGIALSIITIVTGIIFAIKKPKYETHAGNSSSDEKQTEQLKNAYPTEYVSVKNTQISKKQGMSKLKWQETELFDNNVELETEVLYDANKNNTSEKVQISKISETELLDMDNDKTELL